MKLLFTTKQRLEPTLGAKQLELAIACIHKVLIIIKPFIQNNLVSIYKVLRTKNCEYGYTNRFVAKLIFIYSNIELFFIVLYANRQRPPPNFFILVCLRSLYSTFLLLLVFFVYLFLFLRLPSCYNFALFLNLLILDVISMSFVFFLITSFF